MCRKYHKLKYFLSVAAVKMAKKSAGNHLFIQNNNKNCREITFPNVLLVTSQCWKFLSNLQKKLIPQWFGEIFMQNSNFAWKFNFWGKISWMVIEKLVKSSWDKIYEESFWALVPVCFSCIVTCHFDKFFMMKYAFVVCIQTIWCQFTILLRFDKFSLQKI